jgi:uncharacterized protein YqjF (DUF2071 family)
MCPDACHDGAVSFPVIAPPLPRPVLFDQFWGDLTFVHWPVGPQDIAHLFPPGTRPDVFTDGLTYAALVPFVMRHTILGTSVPLPYFGAFPETNVRLYSIDDAGHHGVVFRSLETTRLAVVGFTRATMGVPYTWSKMRVTRREDVISYSSARRWPSRGLRSTMRVRIGDEVAPTPLEVWLTARWGAHTRKAGRTWWVPNDHGPWPLHEAEVIDLDDDLLAAAGVAAAGDRMRALFSPGVRARFGRPSVVNCGNK